jgi:type VI secretion system protein VasD
MRIASLLTVLGAVVACSSATPEPKAATPEKCPPPSAEVKLTATDRVNPSEDGEGRPVQVRIYLLESDARLRNATFEEVWQDDKKALETDLKSVTEYTLFPGKSQSATLKLNPDAHFLAVVALFREPQGKDWFVSYELTDPPTAPPCDEGAPVSLLLDRMQIQDGEAPSMETGAEEGEASSSEGTTESDGNADEGAE